MDLSSRIQNFFNSKKKALGQAVQQAPQQIQSFGENLLKPKTIVDTVTKVGSFFAPQTKPVLQSKPAQNIMTGVATGLSNTVKEGLPAAYRISPLNPQRSPLKINNGKLGFNLLNTPTIPQIKKDVSDTVKAGKLAATVYGIPKLTAGAILTSAGLGGGLNKLFGGSFSEGAGQGLSSAPILSGIGSITNPTITNISSKLAGKTTNPLIQTGINRLTTGALNIPEGVVMKGSLTNTPYDVTDAALDFGMGVLTGSNKMISGKGMVMRREYPKVIPKIEENIKDVIVRYAKAFGEGSDPTNPIVDLRLQEDAVNVWKTMYGDKPMPKDFNGVDLEQIIGQIREGYNGWKTELEMAGQGIRMGILSGDKLKDASEGIYQIFRSNETPEDAVKSIRELHNEAIQKGDQDLFQALKKAAIKYKSELVTGPGLPRDPVNEPVIEAVDEIIFKQIKEINKPTVNSQKITPKEFMPTKNWQEYSPDQTLPLGMEVKSENGKQFARLPALRKTQPGSYTNVREIDNRLVNKNIPTDKSIPSVKQIMENRQSPPGSTLPPNGKDIDGSSDVVEQVFKTKKFNVTEKGAEMLDQKRKDLGFDVRKVKHFDEMKEEGKELQGDLRSLLKRNKNDVVTDAEVSALSDVTSTSTDRILKLTKQLDQDPSNVTIKKQIEIEEALLDQVLTKQIKGGTAVGRAVVAFRILANKTLDRNFWINKAKKQLGDGKRLTAQVIEKIDELVKSKDRIGLAIYIGKLGESTFGEKAVGLWKASLLTGFRTHEANMLGNEIMRNLESVKDIPATMFDVIRAGITGGKRSKSFSFNLKGQVEGLKKGVVRAKEIIKTGADSQDLAKAEMHKPLRFGKTPLGKIGQAITNAVFRTLGAEDKIPFEMNFRRSLEEQAKIVKKNDKLTPQQMRELIENPTEKMLATATKDAAYATFTSENAINDAIRAAKHAGGGKVSAALDVIMPFTKTPTNVAKATFIDYTPVGFVGESAKVVKNLVTKQPVDERALAEAFGRAATGTTILALGAELAKRGLISGSSPTSEAERSQWELENKTPNSIFINGKWRNVGRISPMGNLLLLGAAAEETGYDPEKTTFSGIKGFSENSFLTGAASGIKAITEPDRFADSFVENTIAGYVPNLISDIAAGVDTADKRDPKGLKERMLVKVPGLGRESIPEKLNALGEVKENERGLPGKMFDLFNSSKPTDDPLINEFKRVGYNLNYVENTIGGKNLTRAEGREYQELAGKYIKELVPQVIQSDGYADLTTDQQKDLIERAVNSAKTQAREQIKPKLGLIKDESGIAAEAAEGDEYGSIGSNIDLSVNKDGKKNITKTFIQDGKLKTITVDFSIKQPELSGDTDFDKKLLSKYKSKVSSEINDVYNLYEAGKLSLTEAKEAIGLLENKYKTGSSSGSVKTKKGAKIDYRQFVKAIKPVKVTVSKSRSKPFRALTVKPPSIKQPSLKQLKYKGKVMTLRKKK